MKTYSFARFVSDIPGELLCGVCSEVVTDPLLCTHCDHLFCSHCLEAWERGCPNKCAEADFTKAPRIITRILEDLKVKCEGNGCEYVGRLADMQMHEQQCGCVVTKCENPVCDRKKQGPGCCSKACRDVVDLKECIETSTCIDTVLRRITKVVKRWQRRCRLIRHRANKPPKSPDSPGTPYNSD